MELSPREKIGSTFHKQRGTLLCGELATNGRREEGEGAGSKICLQPCGIWAKLRREKTRKDLGS